MKNIQPDIYRQRLTIEGKYLTEMNEKIIKNFLKQFTSYLKMRPLIESVIFSPNKMNHPLHHGIAGFIAWIESGCSIYTWDAPKFLTVEIYTCKKFDEKKAVKFVNEFFKCKEIVFDKVEYNE